MMKETIELSFDFEKAGIEDIGDRATLECVGRAEQDQPLCAVH